MKTSFVVLMFVLVFFGSLVSSYAEIDLSLTGSLGYSYGKWGSGSGVSPTGSDTHKSLSRLVSGQLIYNRWEWKPTLDLSYKRDRYDFSTWQAYQRLSFRTYSVRVGVTKEIKGFFVYGLIGGTMTRAYVRMVELFPYADHTHGGRSSIQDEALSFKFGVYKMWGEKIKIGPEFSLEVFQKKLGFSRCRELETNRFVPYLGLRIQY